jgi:hypothetical protein
MIRGGLRGETPEGSVGNGALVVELLLGFVVREERFPLSWRLSIEKRILA